MESMVRDNQEESLKWTEKYLNHTTYRPDDRVANILRSQSTPPTHATSSTHATASTHATPRQQQLLERSRSRTLGPRCSEVRDVCLSPLRPPTTSTTPYISPANLVPRSRVAVHHNTPSRSVVQQKPPSGPLVQRKSVAKRRPNLPMICYADNSDISHASTSAHRQTPIPSTPHHRRIRRASIACLPSRESTNNLNNMSIYYNTPERQVVSVQTIPGPVVRTTTTTRRIISNGAPAPGQYVYVDQDGLPVEGRQFVREMTPEVTRRVIYRGGSVPPPSSYSVRELATPTPRITYYPPTTYGSSYVPEVYTAPRRTVYTSPSQAQIMSAARTPLYSSLNYADLDDYRRPVSMDRLKRQADSVRTRLETDRYLATPTIISSPRRRASVTSIYDGITSRIAASPAVDCSSEFDVDLTSNGIQSSVTDSSASPAPCPRAKAFNPQLSETRRRIRKVLCKSHDDPRYYDLE